MTRLNATHDPQRRSWLASANDPATDFPIQNLPFGIFRDVDHLPRGGVAIGDQIVNIAQARAAGLFSGKALEAAALAEGPVLNTLMQAGNAPASALRAALGNLLDAEQREGDMRSRLGACLMPMRLATMAVPVEIPAFTNFMCSRDHTQRMGRGTLPRAFKHLPPAYNSRASSIVVSGTNVTRPNGQFARGETIGYGAEPALDFELELGAFTGAGHPLGTPFALHAAEHHLFGVCLVNDWSARGIQLFESTPLGPFLGKSFATTISPWVVTAEALAPFRTASPAREQGDPEPPHLTSNEHRATGALDIHLEALLLTTRMRSAGLEPVCITATEFRGMYWTFAQMFTHHVSNGCNLQTGDLLASGTVSGPSDASRACLAEITTRGTNPLTLPNGEIRAWLDDGDEVVLRGRTTHPEYANIGFGECRGRVASAPRLATA